MTNSGEQRPPNQPSRREAGDKTSDYIKKVLAYLYPQNDLIELRCPIRPGRTISGYFKDLEKSCQTQSCGAASAVKAKRRGRKSSVDGAAAGAVQADAGGAAS
jgi:hypothetical protein